MNEKLNLLNLLILCLDQVIAGAECKNYSETKEGFYCDFDMPKPLNPDIFEALKQELAQKDISIPYQLDHFSGVYEKGNSKNKMLQRIYVVALEDKKAYEAYQTQKQEASQRDHKVLGQELNLYLNSEEIGQGLILWKQKGAQLRCLMEQFGQAAHLMNGYQWVYTPHIGRANLWKTSGHLDFYKDSMYSPISIDGEEYYLKPMNCPFHITIYNSEVHSYRDLPVRMAEYGTVYRYELSGALSGLTRVRGFTQDDAHIICTPDQVGQEVKNALKFSLYILRSFGFEHFKAYLSTRPKDKSIGADQDWQMATEVLKQAIQTEGLSYQTDEGGGAFYGPKIDIKLTDALGREWQCSTIQFDFNLPARFSMFYVGNDGLRHTPYMLHRALFGSFERFTALLIEHYKGDFPLWLAPLQIGIVPVSDSFLAYARQIESMLKHSGFRARLDDSEKNMKNKIKQFELDKIPLIVVVGKKEEQNQTFSLRSRKYGNLGEMDLAHLENLVKEDLELGKPKYIF